MMSMELKVCRLSLLSDVYESKDANSATKISYVVLLGGDDFTDFQLSVRPIITQWVKKFMLQRILIN